MQLAKRCGRSRPKKAIRRTYSEQLQIDFAAGDAIDFWVDSRGDAGFDGTQFDIVIDHGDGYCTGAGFACQQISLTYAVSEDGGATWTAAPSPDHLVATVPEVYRPDAGLAAMWQPSDIVNPPDRRLLLHVRPVRLPPRNRLAVRMLTPHGDTRRSFLVEGVGWHGVRNEFARSVHKSPTSIRLTTRAPTSSTRQSAASPTTPTSKHSWRSPRTDGSIRSASIS